ncbi:hypothetical protein ACLB2K_002019 [Fragaria x ananassa]
MKMRRRRRVNRLMELPSHILVNILLRLPYESICCIRCVSKDLLNTVDDYSFAKLHMAAADGINLMSLAEPYSSETSAVVASLQPVKYDGAAAMTTRGKYAFKVSTTPHRREYPTYTIDFVFRNLFCFRSKYDSGVCFLINPPMGQILTLPRNDISKDAKSQIFNDWYGMGFDHATNTLKILTVAMINARFLAAQVLVLGTSSWRHIAPPPCSLSGGVNMYSANSACVNGDMHWLVYGDFRGRQGTCHILSFDFEKEQFYWTPHPILQSSDDDRYIFWHLHLLTFRGSLAMVDTSLSQGTITKIDIWVLQDHQWAKQYSIDINNFELVKEFGWLVDVTCGQWEHGIYFKNFAKIPTFFLDLRCYSMNIVTCGSGERTRILTYTGSLKSLKNFVGAENLKSYGNLIEEEAHGFHLSKRHVLQGVSVS